MYDSLQSFQHKLGIDHIALFVPCLLVFNLDKFTSKSIYEDVDMPQDFLILIVSSF